MPPRQAPSKTGTGPSEDSPKPSNSSTNSTDPSTSKSTESATTQTTDTSSQTASASTVESTSNGPWLTALPAMIAAVRANVPLEALGEVRTDLVTMALLADHYVKLVESEDPSVTKSGACTDPAAAEGVHQQSKICIFCAGLP